MGFCIHNNSKVLKKVQRKGENQRWYIDDLKSVKIVSQKE